MLTATAAQDASAALGSQHPLARALALETLLVRHLMLVAALAIGLTAAAGSGTGIALAVGAGMALVGFAFAALAADVTVHERTRDLIADGRENLPVRVVARERERLLSEAHRRMLARTLATYRRHATAPAASAATRANTRELAALELALVQPTRSARAVVLTQRLIIGPRSPLHGPDPARLRAEIRRIVVLLAG